MKSFPFILAAAAACASISCNSKPNTSSGGSPVAVIQHGLTLAPGATPPGDSPAQQAFAALAEAFVEGTSADLSIPIFRLVPPPAEPQEAAASLAAQLGVAGEEFSNRKAVGIKDGYLQVRVTEASGSEFFADWERFHDGEGVPSSQRLSSEEYVVAAIDFVKSQLDYDFGARGMYLYKVREYVNAESELDSLVDPVESVYQVAVAFNASYEGIPTIGTGGKLVVHMKPDAGIVAFENNSRLVEAVEAVAEGSDLMPPADAEDAVRARLEARGIEVDGFDVTRREFGYYQYGRSSRQLHLVPHYAFFFDPKADVVDKRRVEIIPAVHTPSLLKYALEDEAADEVRRSVLFAEEALD